MSEPTIEDYNGQLVPHPRYGSRSVGNPSWMEPNDASGRGWGCYSKAIVFPESAISFEMQKVAKHGAVPPEHYVDVLHRCMDCDRPFVFFALEQKHWCEKLGFFAEVGGRRCYECRRSNQVLKRHRKNLAAHLNEPPREFSKLLDLFAATLTLWKEGELTNPSKFNRIAKLAKAEAPTAEVTRELLAIRSQLIDESNDKAGG